MSDTVRATLLGALILAGSVWVGGYVAIAVVARIATRTMSPVQRVTFFRGLGRSYGVIGGGALAVALGTGAALLRDRAWGGAVSATAAVAAALVLVTAVGVAQARRMTRLRGAAGRNPDDLELAVRVRRGARRAVVLRTAIGLLSIALIALGSLLAV